MASQPVLELPDIRSYTGILFIMITAGFSDLVAHKQIHSCIISLSTISYSLHFSSINESSRALNELYNINPFTLKILWHHVQNVSHIHLLEVKELINEA